MTKNRFSGWAILAVMVASFATVPTEAGPLLEMFGHPHDDEVYSPLHYWLPGIYRLKACLQPLPPDSPPPQPHHLWNNRHILRGDRSQTTIPADSQEMTRPANESYPIAPR